MKNKYIVILLVIINLLVPNAIYANSSWHWLSNNRPYDILLYVVFLTITIETIMVNYFGKINDLKQVSAVIVLSNLMSYYLPYLFVRFMPYALYDNYIDYINHFPVYIVGIGYLLITLVIEIPLDYTLLKKTTNKRELLLSILISNILTTSLVYCIERLYAKGIW